MFWVRFEHFILSKHHVTSILTWFVMFLFCNSFVSLEYTFNKNTCHIMWTNFVTYYLLFDTFEIFMMMTHLMIWCDLVPPRIVEEETSSDIVIDERNKLSLRCKANGYPTPTVTWRREDGKELNLGPGIGSTNKKQSGIGCQSSLSLLLSFCQTSGLMDYLTCLYLSFLPCVNPLKPYHGVI